MNKHLLIFIALLAFQYSNAATNITGQILSSTTWTASGNPYICTGVVEIAPNVTVNIEPGVILIIDGALMVHGSLNLNATMTDSIYITTKNPNETATIHFLEVGLTSSTLDTYKVQYCLFDRTTLWFLNKSMSLVVSECVFVNHYGGIRWKGRQGAILSIHDNYFSSNIYVEPNAFQEPTGKIEIYNNRFEKSFGNETIYISHVGDSIDINNNYFINGRTSIKIHSVTTAWVRENIFAYNIEGIQGLTSTVDYHISGNIFTKNTRAMHLFSNNIKTIYVKHNSIYDNDYGVVVDRWNTQAIAPEDKLALDSNCIYNNKIANLYWGVTNDRFVGTNWWGSTDTNMIDAGIQDDKDDFKKGRVSYQPLLTDNSSCKTAIIPTSIPEKLKITSHTVSVYPNPFNNNITVELGQTKQVKEIALYDLVGKKAITPTRIASNKAIIDTHQLAEGLYIYKITYDDNTTHSGKVLKQ